jgi:hypothetical protein
MLGQAQVLCSNVSSVADTTPLAWVGGVTVITADGSAFPTTCQVQMQGLNGSWISAGSNITAASVSTGLNLPAGLYRVHMTGGTATNVSIALVRVPQ